MKLISLFDSDERLPAIGQGTGIGGALAKSAVYDKRHVDSISHGINLGMTFIDTAEEYGLGQAEIAVGDAVYEKREKVFIATKVSSENLGFDDVVKAAERSLSRLKTDYIDLYQIHWPNPRISMDETMMAMERLIQDGKVRYIGICNASLREIKKAAGSLSKTKLFSVQNEYNLFDRTAENDIFTYCQEQKILFIAYSPLDQGRIAHDKERFHRLSKIAETYGRVPSQIVLNWIVSHQNIIAIPQSINLEHIRNNAESTDFDLGKYDLKKLDSLFEIKIEHIPTKRIRIARDMMESSQVYTSLEEAIENRFDHAPSPEELARDIMQGEVLKPVRIKKMSDDSDKFEYELIEGKLRYWSWVIAYGNKKPIPALVRKF